MRRFLLPVLMLTLALVLSACGANNQAPKKDPAEWGHLRVTLENVQQAERQWSANIAIKNSTDKMQMVQYQGAFKYSLIVTREGKEVLRQDFEPMDPNKPEILNLSAGVVKNHVVVWTYLDQEGKRVEPGTYELSAQLFALTPTKDQPASNTGEIKAVAAPLLGPVKVEVK